MISLSLIPLYRGGTHLPSSNTRPHIYTYCSLIYSEGSDYNSHNSHSRTMCNLQSMSHSPHTSDLQKRVNIHFDNSNSGLDCKKYNGWMFISNSNSFRESMCTLTCNHTHLLRRLGFERHWNRKFRKLSSTCCRLNRHSNINRTSSCLHSSQNNYSTNKIDKLNYLYNFHRLLSPYYRGHTKLRRLNSIHPCIHTYWKKCLVLFHSHKLYS